MTTAVIIDLGSHCTKFGFSGDDAPTKIVPTSNDIFESPSSLKLDNYVNFVRTSLPSVDFQTYNMFISAPPLFSFDQQVALCELCFEDFGVEGFYIGDQSTLALYATGRTSGLVLDSGHISTSATPGFEGSALTHFTIESKYGGKEITEQVQKLFSKYNINVQNIQLVEKWKEKSCRVFPLDNSPCKNETHIFSLPDSSSISIQLSDIQSCTEFLFNSEFSSFDPVQHLIAGSIKQCDPSLINLLYKNIIIIGGNSTMKGFHERCNQEMQNLNVKNFSLKIACQNDSQCKYMSFSCQVVQKGISNTLQERNGKK